jgi:DNA polymerase-3 subunit delta
MAKVTGKAKPNLELVYVITGDEPTLVNAQYSELIDRLIPSQERATGLLLAEADKVSVSEVLDELHTLPFLTKKRVVVIRNADKFISANRETLEKYFENPCPTGILVLTVANWQGNTKLAKKLPHVGSLVKVEAPKGAEIPRRLVAYARDAYYKGLDYDAAELLTELAGDDITRLYTEIDKLAVYAANEKSITTAHVESLVGHNRLFDTFEVIDSCLQRKPIPAVERLRRMFEEDRSAEYTTIGAFAYHFRRLFNVKKMLQEGYSEYDIAKKLWLGRNKNAQLTLLKRLSLKQIGDQIQQLAATDYAIKRGQARPRIAIEQLVLRLAAL